jgi:hypothetical protein
MATHSSYYAISYLDWELEERLCRGPARPNSPHRTFAAGHTALPLRFAALGAYLLVMIFGVRQHRRHLISAGKLPSLGWFAMTMTDKLYPQIALRCSRTQQA